MSYRRPNFTCTPWRSADLSRENAKTWCPFESLSLRHKNLVITHNTSVITEKYPQSQFSLVWPNSRQLGPLVLQVSYAEERNVAPNALTIQPAAIRAACQLFQSPNPNRQARTAGHGEIRHGEEIH